jgi:2OG-Fe(II) oxygenase superfamily
MWRGWHKLPGGDAAFDNLANIPSSFPSSSGSGSIGIVSSTGENLFALVIDEIFPTAYYDSIIEAAELKGFDLASLNQGAGQQEKGITMTEIRSGQRCIFDDVDLANKLWPFVEQHLPHRDVVPGKRYKGWKASGVNPRFRVLKYSSGERFELHQDGSYQMGPQRREDGVTVEQKSFVTFQLYLNDGGGVDFTGGSTRFIHPVSSSVSSSISASVSSSGVNEALPNDGNFSAPSLCDFAVVHDVVPKKGRLLLFQHNCWHEGERVTNGIKYVLRSEVMYINE